MIRHSSRRGHWAQLVLLALAPLAFAADPPAIVPAVAATAAAPTPAAAPAAEAAPVAPVPAAVVAPVAPAPAVPAADPVPQPPTGPLQFNFRGAALEVVLDYLSKAGGFVIVRDTPITGTVDIVSHQPLGADEAIQLLHTVLNDRGYAVIRNGRILRIVRRDEARTRDLPVVSGNDPATVQKTDEVVTQIIPLRHTSATKLIATLQPLLPAQTTISPNEDTNSLVITDTRTTIRRALEIIHALDSAVSSILDIKVLPLAYADAVDTATVINKVFESPKDSAAAKSATDPMAQRAQFFARMRGGGGGGDATSSDAANEAKDLASHVSAVADQRSNSVIVIAPTTMIPQVQELVTQLDVPSAATSTLKVFPLHFADATAIANVISGLYPSTSATTAANNQRGQGGFRGFQPQPAATTTTTASERKLAEAQVTAVADTRMNAVIVSASPGSMANIQAVIEQLDSTPANVPGVHIYHLQNANMTNVKSILASMFPDLATTTSTSNSNTTRSTGTSATSRTTNSGTTATGSRTSASSFNPTGTSSAGR